MVRGDQNQGVRVSLLERHGDAHRPIEGPGFTNLAAGVAPRAPACRSTRSRPAERIRWALTPTSSAPTGSSPRESGASRSVGSLYTERAPARRPVPLAVNCTGRARPPPSPTHSTGSVSSPNRPRIRPGSPSASRRPAASRTIRYPASLARRKTDTPASSSWSKCTYPPPSNRSTPETASCSAIDPGPPFDFRSCEQFWPVGADSMSRGP